MARWIQLPDGSWVVNLDGSDAQVALSTPRVEVRPVLSSWKYNALASEYAWRMAGGHATMTAAQRAGLLALADRVPSEYQRVISQLVEQLASYADSSLARCPIALTHAAASAARGLSTTVRTDPSRK